KDRNKDKDKDRKAKAKKAQKKKNDRKAKAAKKKKQQQAKSQTQKTPEKKKEQQKIKTKPKSIQMVLDKPISEYDCFLETLTPSKLDRYINKTKSFARGVRDQAEGAITSLSYTKEIRVKHIYQLNIKFSMAVVCIIFLFIGGPMGAIIRKGGFGYPILVAIFFFIIFMIMNIFFKKLAESFVIAPEWAPWLPCLILMPVGVVLTHRAMNDMKMINTDPFKKIFNLVKKRFKKKKAS
ncbi:MAG: lipopolysaccharide export system permease protein, partial [Flavobacteriales bacterium]